MLRKTLAAAGVLLTASYMGNVSASDVLYLQCGSHTSDHSLAAIKPAPPPSGDPIDAGLWIRSINKKHKFDLHLDMRRSWDGIIFKNKMNFGREGVFGITYNFDRIDGTLTVRSRTKTESGIRMMDNYTVSCKPISKHKLETIIADHNNNLPKNKF